MSQPVDSAISVPVVSVASTRRAEGAKRARQAKAEAYRKYITDGAKRLGLIITDPSEMVISPAENRGAEEQIVPEQFNKPADTSVPTISAQPASSASQLSQLPTKTAMSLSPGDQFQQEYMQPVLHMEENLRSVGAHELHNLTKVLDDEPLYKLAWFAAKIGLLATAMGGAFFLGSRQNNVQPPSAPPAVIPQHESQTSESRIVHDAIGDWIQRRFQ